MDTIITYLTHEHESIDEVFAAVEAALAENEWDQALEKFEAFTAELVGHIRKEEDVLFPALEAATGMTMGPTQMMRIEHEQMQTILTQIKAGLTAKNMDQSAGQIESLMILIQQHNMKEEQMLYPMAEQQLAGNMAGIISDMQAASKV